ncbi:unnamed protein product, partial [Vitis vinifera]
QSDYIQNLSAPFRLLTLDSRVYNVLLQAMELANARSALKRKRDDAIEPFDNGTAATATTDASSVDLSLLEAVEKSQTTVENLFDCLCCLLMPLENKERFVRAEGVELMIIIMKQKKLAYGSAIRALDFAMTKYPPACERFVDVLGLKTAFAAFMGKIPMSKKNKKERYQEELEERIISLIASLFGGILRGSRRDRLLSKFVENECEKIDRLMELYIRYSDRVKAETERMNQLKLDDLEMDEDERYNRRLEVGLYTLQLISIILGHLWSSENPRMQARIELLLNQQRITKEDIKDILQEYHDNIGDVDGQEEKERAQAKIQKFISAF